MQPKDPRRCEHDNLEPLTDLVTWCPDCGSQWASTREQIERVRSLFYAKLAERYPGHPWVELSFRK